MSARIAGWGNRIPASENDLANWDTSAHLHETLIKTYFAPGKDLVDNTLRIDHGSIAFSDSISAYLKITARGNHKTVRTIVQIERGYHCFGAEPVCGGVGSKWEMERIPGTDTWKIEGTNSTANQPVKWGGKVSFTIRMQFANNRGWIAQKTDTIGL